MNEIEPEAAPPTAQDSCHEPTVEESSVPDLEKLPLASVDPMAEPENELPGMEPEAVTGAFGEAPEIETVQVSPTRSDVPPRLVVKVS